MPATISTTAATTATATAKATAISLGLWIAHGPLFEARHLPRGAAFRGAPASIRDRANRNLVDATLSVGANGVATCLQHVDQICNAREIIIQQPVLRKG